MPVTQDMIHRAVDPLNDAIVVDRDDRVRRRIDDRVVSGVLTLPQYPLSRNGYGNVGNLQKTIICMLCRYRTNNDIVEDRLPAFTLQGQQRIQRMGQDAGAADLKCILDDTR